MTGKEKTAQFIPMTRTQAAIGGSTLISFFVVWFLWAAVGEYLLFFVENNPGMASWIQAIGSIAAIFGSAWITRNYFIKAEIGKEMRAARQLILVYREIRLFFLNWCYAHKSILENDSVNSQTLKNFTAITTEIMSCAKEVVLSDLSHDWSSTAMKTRFLMVNIIEELDSIKLIQENFKNSYLNASSKDKLELIEKRRKNLKEASDSIILLAIQADKFQKDLIKSAEKKHVFFAPIDISNEMWFQDFEKNE